MRRVGAAVAAAVGVLAGLFGVASGLIDVKDALRSDPPVAVGATLSNVRVTNAGVTLRDFLVGYFELGDVPPDDNERLRAALRERDLPDDVSDEALQTLGAEITFDVTLDGLKGRECPLKWSLFDATSRRPLPDAYLTDRPAFPYPSLIPDSEHDRASVQIWIPRPPRAGPYFVRLELYDDRPVQQRVPLAVGDSEAFPLTPVVDTTGGDTT